MAVGELCVANLDVESLNDITPDIVLNLSVITCLCGNLNLPISNHYVTGILSETVKTVITAIFKLHRHITVALRLQYCPPINCIYQYRLKLKLDKRTKAQANTINPKLALNNSV